MTTNLGKWDGWHTAIEPFGTTASYQLGAEWLEDCELVEDWGCGGGYFSKYVPHYRGVDGSRGPKTDIIADLTEYRSEVPGIFVRHVLEHNLEWEKVLDNALASFTERMFLVLFTPLAADTHDVEWEDPPGVPNISFALGDLLARFRAAGVKAGMEALGNDMPYGRQGRVGTETVFRIER